MLLAIDVGNTNAVLGLFQGDLLVSSWRIKTDARTTADEMALTYRGLLADSDPVTGIALCSTVPAVLREMRLMLDTYFSEVPTVIVEPGTKTGVPVLTDNPKEVGADRIVNALAAAELYGGPAIVVDLNGTATIFDVVDDSNRYIGGAIAPGVELAQEGLARRGAQLRSVELALPRDVIGKNTVEAIQSGLVFGFAGLVDGMVDRIIDSLGADPDHVTVVATGSYPEAVLDQCGTITTRDPWLTLTGLRLIHERNQ